MITYYYCYYHKLITEDVETRFDTLNYELGKLSRKIKNKKDIGLMKDELGEKLVIKCKRHKKVCLLLKFENY